MQYINIAKIINILTVKATFWLVGRAGKKGGLLPPSP